MSDRSLEKFTIVTYFGLSALAFGAAGISTLYAPSEEAPAADAEEAAE